MHLKLLKVHQCISENLPTCWSLYKNNQFVIFKTLSYCFEEIIGFDVKALFTSRPVSRLIS